MNPSITTYARSIFLCTVLSATATTLTMASDPGHEQLTGPFASFQGVTNQCLICHAQQGQDILNSSHWTWQRTRSVNGTEKTYSKKLGLTTFAIPVAANPEQCMTCHISSNLLSDQFDPTSALNIDCLVCHDTTGMYKREAGAPAEGLDLALIAKKVGTPSAANCKTCHDSGCGLPESKGHSGIDRDIHLNPNGAGLTCQSCHPSNNHHSFSRKVFSDPAVKSGTGCSSCHSITPHQQVQLNEHAEIIACQTCHIPTYAGDKPRIVSWNWLAQVDQAIYADGVGNQAPLIATNGLIQATGIRPTYLWDDGSEELYQRGMKIDTNKTTVLLGPGPRSTRSKIKPFAVSYGTQLYDAKYRYLISPSLSGNKNGYFDRSDWENTAKEGMKHIRLPFSGSYLFASTVTYRPLNHGVVPAGEAMNCMDCHGKNGMVNWKSLGYELDPWDGDRKTVQAPLAPPTQSTTENPVDLLPINETVLPPSPET